MALLRFFKRVASFAVFLFVFMLVAGYCLASAYARFDLDEQSAIFNDFIAISDNFYTDNEDNRVSVEKLTNFVSLLPDSISETFNKEWKVIVSEDMPEVLQQHAAKQPLNQAVVDSSENFVVTGYTNWHLRTIYIKKQDDNQNMYHVFAHEFGHLFDYEFGCLSSVEDFSQIYSAYVNSFCEENRYSINGYATSSPEEFFATVFKEFMISPEILKNKAPDVYDFINDMYLEVSLNHNASNTMTYDLHAALMLLNEKFLIKGENK